MATSPSPAPTARVAERRGEGGVQSGQVAEGHRGRAVRDRHLLGQKDTFPNGSHICEVEIDPDTGEVKVDRYVVVDDVGTVINPIGLKGQIHGGVAQGIGQVLGAGRLRPRNRASC